MKRTFIRLVAVALCSVATMSAHAAVIVKDTGGTSVSSSQYVGESFTTPTDFLYYNLTFNFYSNSPATTPQAAGTAFLLSQPYAGTPAALSLTTPGFLTESSSSAGGVFTFNPNFVLLTGTTYYLYTDTAQVVSFGDTSMGFTRYAALVSTSNYTTTASAANFSLNGTRVGVPLQALEPGATGRFVRVSDADPEMLRWLAERAVRPGDDVEVLDKQPFDGPLTVRVGELS